MEIGSTEMLCVVWLRQAGYVINTARHAIIPPSIEFTNMQDKLIMQYLVEREGYMRHPA